MTPRERLLALAPLLWGERWQTEMGREMRIGRRTLSRYVHAPGKTIPPALLQRLTAAALDRLDALADALDLPEALRAGLAIELDYTREHLRIPRRPADAE